MSLSSLPPAAVWTLFAALCAIPRPSKHEDRVRDWLRRWADEHGLDHQVDNAGNLLVRRAAAPGRERAPALALQAHLDMVCQAGSGVRHDFLQDPIRPRLDGDWLIADDTTLGADNGLGVALALAALADPPEQHGPLEVLLTVDEEAGMGGARGLRRGWLNARRMINLDSEGWGEFYVGCAGGGDVDVHRAYAATPLPADCVVAELTIGGLRGGHSGLDIGRRRGNANRLLVEALHGLADAGLAVRLIALAGGSARNALPREAAAVFALPAGDWRTAKHRLDAFAENWRHALIGDDGESRLEVTLATPAGGTPTADEDAPAPAKGTPTSAITAADSAALLGALFSSPYGVRAISADFPGVVETSNNLGLLTLEDGRFAANLMVRSLRDAEAQALADTIAAGFRAIGCAAENSGAYPGWQPDPASPLLALARRVFRDTFGGESAVRVIHAGLECGIIRAGYPELDVISFGPEIRGAHAPGERVDTRTVAQCWRLLRALIAADALS